MPTFTSVYSGDSAEDTVWFVSNAMTCVNFLGKLYLVAAAYSNFCHVGPEPLKQALELIPVKVTNGSNHWILSQLTRSTKVDPWPGDRSPICGNQ